MLKYAHSNLVIVDNYVDVYVDIDFVVVLGLDVEVSSIYWNWSLAEILKLKLGGDFYNPDIGTVQAFKACDQCDFYIVLA